RHSLPRTPGGLVRADVTDEQRGAVTLGDDDVADVVGGFEEPDAANQILLLALVDVTPAGIRAAAVQSHEQLLQRDAVDLHLCEIGLDLILLDEAAVGYDIGHARNRFQLPGHGPVLNRAQARGR